LKIDPHVMEGSEGDEKHVMEFIPVLNRDGDVENHVEVVKYEDEEVENPIEPMTTKVDKEIKEGSYSKGSIRMINKYTEVMDGKTLKLS
jgi:hypothetical protein